MATPKVNLFVVIPALIFLLCAWSMAGYVGPHHDRIIENKRLIERMNVGVMAGFTRIENQIVASEARLAEQRDRRMEDLEARIFRLETFHLEAITEHSK